MFVNQEITDHFPGEFTNFYRITLNIDLPETNLKSGDEIEVVGKDATSFLYVKGDQHFTILKENATILKKMIKSIKNKS